MNNNRNKALIATLMLTTMSTSQIYAASWYDPDTSMNQGGGFDFFTEKQEVKSLYGIALDKKLQKGEVVYIIDKMLNLRDDGRKIFSKEVDSYKYAPSIRKAIQIGLIRGDAEGKLNLNKAVTVEEALTLFARALSAPVGDGIDTKIDNFYQISNTYKPAIFGMEEAGFLKNKKFNPKSSATINSIQNIINIPITGQNMNNQVIGNTVINQPFFMLKDKTINGDVIISEAVGNLDVTLENLIVKGRIIIRGGSSAIPTKFNNVKCESVVIEKGMKLDATDSALGTITVSADGAVLTGDYYDIIVNTEGRLRIEDASISSITTLKAPTINIDSDSHVSELNLFRGDNARVVTEGDVISLRTMSKYSNITVLGGLVNSIHSAPEAYATEISVLPRGTVESLIMESDNGKVSSSGVLKKANILSNNVRMNTSDTRVVIKDEGQNVTNNNERLDKDGLKLTFPKVRASLISATELELKFREKLDIVPNATFNDKSITLKRVEEKEDRFIATISDIKEWNTIKLTSEDYEDDTFTVDGDEYFNAALPKATVTFLSASEIQFKFEKEMEVVPTATFNDKSITLKRVDKTKDTFTATVSDVKVNNTIKLTASGYAESTVTVSGTGYADPTLEIKTLNITTDKQSYDVGTSDRVTILVTVTATTSTGAFVGDIGAEVYATSRTHRFAAVKVRENEYSITIPTQDLLSGNNNVDIFAEKDTPKLQKKVAVQIIK